MYNDIANVFFALMLVLAVPTFLFKYKATKDKNKDSINWCWAFLFAGGLICCMAATVLFKMLGAE